MIQRQLFRWAFLLALSVSPLTTSGESASAIHILLLDGNSGKPMNDVNLFINPDCERACLFPGNRISWKTNGSGEIEVPNLPDLRRLRLMKPTDYFKYCQDSENHGVSTVNPDSFSVADILRTGLVAPNTCNRGLRVPPRPGQLVFFLRELTWWEQLTKPPQM